MALVCARTCRSCDGHCPYGELLLLIAIHLKEKQLDQIEELIADTLNMKVSVSQSVYLLDLCTCAKFFFQTRALHFCVQSSLRSGHFSSLSKLFLQVFTEDVRKHAYIVCTYL